MTGRPSVAITGATSFTAPFLARAFTRARFRVVAACPRAAYTGRKGRIGREVAAVAHVRHGVSSSDGGLAAWARELRPEIWIHHHHPMGGFRSPDYDLAAARPASIDPLPELVDALAKGGCRGIVLSGSYFEPGEGGPAAALAPTPYARSKSEVWDALREIGRRSGVRVAKVVVPNVIGPGEDETRLVPALLAAARERRAFELRAPGSVSDQLPADALAEVYVEAAQALLAGEAQVRRPAGRAETVEALASRVCVELVEQHLGAPAPEVREAKRRDPAVERRNPEREVRACDWPAFWAGYARWIGQGFSTGC